MKTIILPIDFSTTTDLLVEGAVKFAKEINAKINLIHVASNDAGFIIGDAGFQYFPEVEKAEIKRELNELNELETKIKNQGLEVSHILKQGVASDTILDYAKEVNANYIVMGSHGRSGLYDVFIGSLTKELTKLSEIPVLVIPCNK